MLPMVYMALVDDEDVPAFEKMYNRTYKKLYSIAHGILKDHQLAEDALLTVILKIPEQCIQVTHTVLCPSLKLTQGQAMRQSIVTVLHNQLDLRQHLCRLEV